MLKERFINKSYGCGEKLRSSCGTLFLLLVLPMAASCVGSCDVYTGILVGSAPSDLSVATWNLQALFDGRDDGVEYDEYSGSNGWNNEKYLARLNTFSKAISSIGKNGPDIIALIEVENAAVLENLADEYLADNAYRYSFFAGLPGYSLGLGLLSRYPLTRALSHSSNIRGEILPRPVAEVWLEPEGESMVVFICHWKSKLGGDEATEMLRREAARVILRRIKAIKAEFPDTPILILGDLNENYDEFERQDGELRCALMPDSPEAAKITGYDGDSENDEEGSQNGEEDTVPEPPLPQDFLVLSMEKPPSSSFFPGIDGVFYTPWEAELEKGSYYYNGGWESIDHLLLSEAFFDSAGWEFKDASVVDTEPFVNSKGEPNTYNTRTGSGLSDHLPLLLTLENKKR
ncbi:MAG: endonuclease/exonuclease/phosphatase family protein [Spirochaetaceae bacterium]|jgi:endonuclease/exonuclease/phosphatase family metal-dependent hydrolase|nr:endonuclease/exonuclease/phosphatase family protein [Spirochaetaceae bacterium]